MQIVKIIDLFNIVNGGWCLECFSVNEVRERGQVETFFVRTGILDENTITVSIIHT